MSVSPDSIRAQIEALRKKLLDLSMRNRMLNYRPSKRIGVTVLGEDSFHLHRLMVEEGKKMTFVGRPDPVERRQRTGELFAPDDDVAMEEFRQAAQDELDAFLANSVLPTDVMDTKLGTDDYESVLQAKLRMISREATLAQEELGINTLFLTLGTLEWSENEQRSYRAPLLFIPVVLERQKNGSLRLIHDGSDVGTNLPLRAKLAEFNLKLPDFDEEKSLLDYFSEIESTIQKRLGWQVHRDEICLGFFNYEKYAMYVDLGGDAWPEGKKPWQNKDLSAMLGEGYSSPESSITDETHIDAIRPVSAAHEVYDADNSQVIAMIRAAEGLSIVVEGPPGTGKSQTITNMIAEAVAASKTVLFVSAKRAALEVVKRNLDKADLGAMCLDLHDKLTNRREFYGELKRTVNRSVNVRSEDAKVARLTELRDRINAHSNAVNEVLPQFGVSPFQAMSILAALPAESTEDREGRVPFEPLSTLQDGDVKRALPLVEALQARLKSTGVPVQHPFWGTAIDYLDPSRRLDLSQDLAASRTALGAACQAMNEALVALQVDVAPSVANLSVLKRCVAQALAAPPHDGIAIRSETWKSQQAQVESTIGALKRLREVQGMYSAHVRPEIWTADLLQIEHAYDRYAEAWYKPFVGSYRSARRNLEVYLTQSAAKEATSRRDLVRDIRSAQTAESYVQSQSESMRRLIGVQWQGVDTDPAMVERVLTWVLELGDKIESGELPQGLLDFFEGSHDNARAQELVNIAERAAQSALEGYSGVAALLKFDQATAADEHLAHLLARVEQWETNLPRLPEYIAYNETRKRVLEASLEGVFQVADRWPLASDRLRDTFVRSYYSGVVREAMESRPELKVFEREGHEAMIREFQLLDDFKLKYNRAQVRLAHQRRLPTFDNALGNLHTLKLQCELQRKHKPIRWIMSRAGEAIQRIKPVFMMSPLSVAIHLPSDLPPFDVVIFDEASQIKPEDALCSIVRANQCIVVGDTRQMPPTSFFDRLSDDDDLEDTDEVGELGAEARKLESVLSLMSAVTMGRVRRPDLRWHYRSVHPSLIQPSNEMFYENRLIVFPSPGTNQNGKRVGVVFHHHPETVYEPGARKRINRREAEIVADHVLQHITDHPEQSLLVAAMNKSQADLIYAEVQKRERQNPEAFRVYNELHPFEPLDPKNLENIQGDERDVIFISITYGRDSAGVLRQQFGPLLVDGGERRLNVLVTRARQRCEVFSNITADDIRLDGPRPGVQALKRYLRFAKDGVTDVPMATGLEEESPFEEEVTAALRDHGYIVDPQVGTEGYRIDIGVVDPDQPGRYLLGVECDGATYHRARSARDRDKLRQRVLEVRGWTLHRIWSHDWWQDRDGEIRRLIAAIQAAQERSEPEPSASMEPAPEVVIQEGNGSRHNVAATRPYTTAELPLAVTTSEDISAYMIAVVQAEGPITEDLLMARLRNALGVKRAGSNIRPWLQSIIDSTKGNVKFLDQEYYATEDQLKVPRDWSTRPTSERKAESVPEIELAAAVRAVVSPSFGVPPEQAAKAAYQLIGFKRVSEAAESRALNVIQRMIEAKGLTRTQDGLLRMPEKKP